VPILADLVDVVIGVDAHTDTHTAAMLSAAGAVLAEFTVNADDAGAAVLLAWVASQAGGPRRQWVIDGARSHGIGLTRFLLTAGETVLDAARIPGSTRRRGGKSDRLDAIAVARVALTAEHLTTPRRDGDREALRILHVARRHYTDARTATVNLLKSLILTADDALRRHLRGLNTDQQVRELCRLQAEPADDLDAVGRVRRAQLRALATDIAAIDQTLADNLTQLRDLVAAMCPTLLDQPGVGPVTAAVALTAWSHPGRLRNEAAFAALGGVNPIPASSGRTIRHRLNRGGDRTLNAALHTIALSRRRYHQPTRDYVARRTAEGKTLKEINRCLKRYIARQLFRLMQATA
jgi:transposase